MLFRSHQSRSLGHALLHAKNTYKSLSPNLLNLLPVCSPLDQDTWESEFADDSEHEDADHLASREAPDTQGGKEVFVCRSKAQHTFPVFNVFICNSPANPSCHGDSRRRSALL